MVEETMATNPAPATPPTPANGPSWFVACLLPWLLGAGMLVVYGLTLNHAISLENYGMVARAEGLLWTPTLLSPVSFLIAEAFGWLPAVWIPTALNLFTAVCAALSLACLARSVALLPHDLSKQPGQKLRIWVFTPPELMVRRAPWLPPLVAVLVCGLQLSFWQNAVSATNEMFNLLMFAYVIRSFLEFNASGRDAWLMRGALVYGLAMANDWFMALFFPLFFLAVIWVKRLFIFNPLQIEQLMRRRDTLKFHLLWLLPSLWLAGFLLILLLPVLAHLEHPEQAKFWTALKYLYYSLHNGIAGIRRQVLLAFFLISVLPAFLIGLRFYHFLAGFNRLSYFIGAVFFQLVYGFFLLIGSWIMLDSPLSPRRLAPGLPALPLYFLEALSIGFLVGHFLLTSEVQGEPPRRGRLSSFERHEKQLRLFTRVLKWLALVAILLLAAGLPATLVCKNFPILAAQRVNPCADYVRQVEHSLPPGGAVLIGADSFRLTCLQADFIRLGRQHDYLVLNSEALVESPEYFEFVKKQSPEFNLKLNLTNASDPEQRKLIPLALLHQLDTNHDLYCLHPAPLGEALAELYYFQPQNLIYHLKPYPTDSPFAPPLPRALIEENQNFWERFRAQQFTNLVRQTDPPQRAPVSGLVKRFLSTLRFRPEIDARALVAGSYYAGALNDWGVTLQQEGQYAAAGRCFTEALQLNPLNAPAQLNQKFNDDYQAGRPTPVQPPLETAEGLNQFRDLHHVLREGAVDEPNYCFLLGTLMTRNQLYRPAIAQFERVKALAPARLETYTALTAVFAACRDFTNALTEANTLLARSPTNTMGLVLKASAQIQLERYSEAIPLLDQVLSQEPTNQMALLNRAQAWNNLGQFPMARRDYQTLLQINPDDFRVYFALAGMDERAQQTASAITNYQLFLKYAPPGVREIDGVKARLKALTPAPPK